MQKRITIDGMLDLHIANKDVLATYDNHEVHFTYIGLSNDRVSERYLLFSLDYHIEPQAILYGDGFQMHSQVCGRLEDLRDIGLGQDNSSTYRLYPRSEAKRFYNHVIVSDSLGYTLFGFTSCHRFSGYFQFSEMKGIHKLSAYLDGENTYPQDWSSSQLESVLVLQSANLQDLYAQYADRLAVQHPPRRQNSSAAPIGWSGHHAYDMAVNDRQLQANLNALPTLSNAVEYVLIDEGYQAAIGDWLTPSELGGIDVKQQIKQIRAAGKKPAIWLAPFIAQQQSELFKHYPDWFVKNEADRPLKAEEITHAGWHSTPWYILDMTNPDVQEHIGEVVRYMRVEWGIELFKLDACYWGAIKAQRSQTGLTGVEAYRMGMQAIADAADSAIVMANHAPLWPSLGMVDVMGIGAEVVRDERRFEQHAKEVLLRSWQHRRLWKVDPDSLVLISLPNQGTERKYYDFHRTVHLACAGVLMLGDPLDEMTAFAKQSIDKLIIRLQHNQEAVRFSTLNLQHGSLALTANNDLHCLFNYQQPAREVTLAADHPVDWHDFWTGEKLNQQPIQAFEITLESGLSARAILTVG
ncbi:glycoside hydrolase family 36 protein [Vibrio scophthalmi]|uniref:glycoside hydrolase family 36 protein n=1 Tax=Vibrio scophthalmi TaxID=45658 RepID=UPI003EBB3553